MEPTLGLWDLIHLLGSAQGIFLSIIFFSHKRGNILANRFLGLLLLIFSVRLMEIVAYWTKYLLVFPHFAMVAFPLMYLFGVVFYYYSKHLSTGANKLDKYFMLHLIPFAIVLLNYMPFYLLNTESKLEKIINLFYSTTGDFSQMSVLDWASIMFQFPHALIYVSLAFFQLKKLSTKKTISNQKIKTVRLKWLKRLSIGFACFFGAWTLYNLSFFLGGPYNKIIDLSLISSVTVFIYAIGYTAFQKPEIHSSESNGVKYEKSTLSSEKAGQYLSILNEIMEKEKLYKNNNLKLSDLAQKLDISSHHLSQIINEKLNRNFFDYINELRIEEAKKVLSNPASKQYTLLSIAHEVGFNNKTSFNSFFKKHTGTTPSEFRSNALNES